MSNIKEDSRNYKQNERDINYELRYFYKVTDSIPDYIEKNLSEMPNNKGYIWRGMFIYGHLPPENNNIITITII